MQAAKAANSSISVKFSQSTSPSDYTPIINTFVSQKCNIIVTLGFAMGDATKAAAKAHPSQKFAIVDNVTPGANVNSLVFNTVQDAFMGGYLAAGMTKTGKVATFGGQEFPTVTIYMDGYWDGVQYYNQKHGTHVQVLGWNEKTQKGSFTGDFTNQTKGQTLTQTFISEGADIIFPVAGNVGLGAAKAVQQADAQAGSQKVNMEWVDLDGCVSAATYCKYFITSVLKGRFFKDPKTLAATLEVAEVPEIPADPVKEARKSRARFMFYSEERGGVEFIGHAGVWGTAMFYQPSRFIGQGRPTIPDNWKGLDATMPTLTSLVAGAPSSGYLAILFLNLGYDQRRPGGLAKMADASDCPGELRSFLRPKFVS